MSKSSFKSRRHRLGQHFLRDDKVVHSIAAESQELFDQVKGDTVLEIGPGDGALTDSLIEAFGTKLSVCEKDLHLIKHWKDRWKERLPEGLKFLEGDFLDLPEALWLSNSRLCVVSNLPYSAASAIVLRLVKHRPKYGTPEGPGVVSMILMFQAEVAKRLYAEPDSDHWGSLSIAIQNDWDVKPFLKVSKRSFVPPPKVESEVIILTPRAQPRIHGTEKAETRESLDRLVKSVFLHRRKMLRSSLSHSPEKLRALEAAGIDLTRRAESLNWEEWNGWFKNL